jgi:hypothetical protein
LQIKTHDLQCILKNLKYIKAKILLFIGIFCQIDEIAKIKIQTFVNPYKKSNIDETYIKKSEKKFATNKNIRKFEC